MELTLQRQMITINEVVYDGYVEQPIECDALLPDYCPDIVKVLKCGVTTHLHSTTTSGDRLTVEGMAVAHIYYSSEKNQIRHVEYKIPFGKSVDLRSAPHSPVITVLPSVDYVNCRAVNQRRVDVRGAITFTVKVTDQKQEQVISGAEGAGIQLRRDMLPATELVSQNQSPFSVSEELELGYGKSAIGSIIRTDCRVNVQDHKIIAGKIVAKGDFMLHILYQPQEDEGALEVMEYSLPISQIIDCAGVDEQCICMVEMVCASCDVQPKTGDDGEYRTFMLDARIMAMVSAYRHHEIPVASDCFSTKYECKCTHRPVSFMRLSDMISESLIHKVTLDLPENVEKVVDAWCEVDTLNWKHEQNAINASLKLTVSMFAKMENGECLYFEQQSEMEQILPIQGVCAAIQFEPTADILSSTFNLVGKEKIDMRCEVLIKGCVHCTVRQNSIGDITVDESSVKVKEQNKLYIYYADEGESVWNIAKRYNTSPGAIWEENAVEEDTLGKKTMLLIPIL